MTTFTIELPDEQAQRIRDTARSLGVSPEELLSAGVSDFLAHQEDDFQKAATYVLKKNEELYRRLA